MNITCMYVFTAWRPLCALVKMYFLEVPVVSSLYCRLRPVAGYAMASLRQHSAAPVAGGSSRFCFTPTLAEHLGVSLSNGWREHTDAARLSPWTASPICYQWMVVSWGGGVLLPRQRGVTVGKPLARLLGSQISATCLVLINILLFHSAPCP